MPDEGAKRKLTSIFYADVAGYSRLTSDDELGTPQRVMAARDDASKQVQVGGGSVLRYAGDAILAEFPSSDDSKRTDSSCVDDCDLHLHR